jgi:hypothetical protein
MAIFIGDTDELDELRNINGSSKFFQMRGVLKEIENL